LALWPDQVACEELLAASTNLPWTIIRPSHTVRTGLPTMTSEGDVLPRRMLEGRPVFVAGDGATPWTLTRTTSPCPSCGSSARRRRSVKSTTSPVTRRSPGTGYPPSARAGVTRIVHVPTDTLVRYKPDWIGPLIGDKSWSALFDNSKVKAVAGDFTCETDLDEYFRPIAASREASRRRQAAQR